MNDDDSANPPTAGGHCREASRGWFWAGAVLGLVLAAALMWGLITPARDE
jgi:hypothetical protein